MRLYDRATTAHIACSIPKQTFKPMLFNVFITIQDRYNSDAIVDFIGTYTDFNLALSAAEQYYSGAPYYED